MDIQKDYNEYFYEPFCDLIDEDGYWNAAGDTEPPFDLTGTENVYRWILYAAKQITSLYQSNWSRETVSSILTTVYSILEAKNADYGGSAFQVPCFAPGMPVDAAIRVRMSDKWNRYRNLKEKGSASVSSETLLDTIYDFIGYAVLLCMVMNSETDQGESLSDGAIIVYYPNGITLSELRNRVSACDVQIIPIQ